MTECNYKRMKECIHNLLAKHSSWNRHWNKIYQWSSL